MHRQRDCGKHRHQPRYLVYMEEKFPILADTLKREKMLWTGKWKKPVTTGTRVQLRRDEQKYEGGVMTERKVTKKHVPPDTTAQIFWLKNRKPEQWRDKPRSESASDKALVKAIEILGGVDSAID